MEIHGFQHVPTLPNRTYHHRNGSTTEMDHVGRSSVFSLSYLSSLFPPLVEVRQVTLWSRARSSIWHIFWHVFFLHSVILSDMSSNISSGICIWRIFWYSFWRSIWRIFWLAAPVAFYVAQKLVVEHRCKEEREEKQITTTLATLTWHSLIDWPQTWFTKKTMTYWVHIFLYQSNTLIPPKKNIRCDDRWFRGACTCCWHLAVPYSGPGRRAEFLKSMQITETYPKYPKLMGYYWVPTLR